jgi:hypothetical protein
MTEPVALSAKSLYQPKNKKTLADYNEWFAKSYWSLEEVAALVLGLNPDVVLDPALAAIYDDVRGDSNYPETYQLWQYSEKAVADWRELLEKSAGDFRDYYCSSELDEIVSKNTHVEDTETWVSITAKPMDIIQWCVDENIPLHYNLTEYLLEKGYDFRFSKNSRIFSEIQIHAKKDVWYMPYAARLVLGFSPESPKILLIKHKNLYRHLDPNYSMTQRDEVYYVMELALESWKTKKLDFFEIAGDDPEDNYYNDEECSVHIESKKFVKWAIEKGFTPPVQLLELMGLKSVEQGQVKEKPARDSVQPPYWIDFSDASGEVVLNDIFVLAKPIPNDQNYRIIRYLIAHPNRFVEADELQKKALDGKAIDKRLTDFASQVNMSKDLGKLFFDTSKDSIRLNNPITPERMTEQNMRRVRIKPA